MPTAQSYYEDSSQNGNYQYTNLKDIIDSFVFEGQDDDSFIKNIKRSKILYHAKMGVKELNKNVSSDILAVEISVGSNLKVVLPQDYVNWVRVSLVTDDYRLVPLNINRNINVAKGYLQAHDYQLLFDSNGDVLTADASNAYNKPFQIYEFDSDLSKGGKFMMDTSEISKYGEFNIDERRGCMVFSSNLLSREIVLEYVSDGLQWEYIEETDITVHKYVEEALKAWVYYYLIAARRNVPYNEKQRALLRYKTLLHQTKLERADINLIEVDKVMRKKNKWL